MTTQHRRRFVVQTTRLVTGGMLSVLRLLAPHLLRHGAVEVIAHGPSTESAGVASRDVGGRFSAPFRFPGVWLYAARICFASVRAARAREGRVTAFIPQDSLGTGFGATVAGAITGVPVVVMEHGSARAIRTRFFWEERQRAVRFRDRVTRPFLIASLRLMHAATLRSMTAAFLPSEEAVRLYTRDGVPQARLVRYHVAVDLERFRPGTDAERVALRRDMGLQPDATIILAVARLAPEKGIDVLVDAYARLSDEPAAQLVIAGDGPLRAQLEAQAAALPRCRFMGRVDDARLTLLLRAADIFAYSSRQGTNVPNATLEAMAAGLAVVATPEPVAHLEMFAAGRGTVVPHDDPAAMGDALERYVASPEQRIEAGRAARAYVEEFHSIGRFAREVDALVERLSAPAAP